MEVYVRRSVQRILNDGQRCVCLDIGNVTVYDKGKGQFTAFLRQAHEMNPWGATYVESVLTPRFGTFLLREGFVYREHSIPPSYYKIKAANHE